MRRFGLHLSVAGGHRKAAESALRLGASTLQVFTKSPNQWAGPPITPEAALAFRTTSAEARLAPLVAHDSYLINLASPDETLFLRSAGAMADELRRSELLGVSYLVAHPGSHVGSGEEAGVERFCQGLARVFAEYVGPVVLCLEVTAGQGSALGWRFEHLAAILGRFPVERLGVCFDTCHALAAGYPLDTPEGVAETLAEFNGVVGLGRVKVWHVNDSKKGRGSRVDRHAHLGEGAIGEASFRALLSDPRLGEAVMILETPKEDRDGEAMDAVNLRRLREWSVGDLRSSPSSPPPITPVCPEPRGRTRGGDSSAHRRPS